MTDRKDDDLDLFGQADSRPDLRPSDARPPALIEDRRPWLQSNVCSIEQLLIWTYRDQKAENYGAGSHLFAAEQAVAGQAVRLQAHSSSMILQHERLGARIDTSRNLGFDLHEVAELTHIWVTSLSTAAARLVMECARTGTRPSVPTCVRPKIVPAQYANAAQTKAVDYREWCYDNEGHRYPLDWCDVIISNTRTHLLQCYERYVGWCLSLNALCDALAMQDQVTFEVTPVTIERDIFVEICQRGVDVDPELKRLFAN